MRTQSIENAAVLHDDTFCKAISFETSLIHYPNLFVINIAKHQKTYDDALTSSVLNHWPNEILHNDTCKHIISGLEMDKEGLTVQGLCLDVIHV